MCLKEKRKYNSEIKKITAELTDCQIFFEKSKEKARSLEKENIVLKNRIKSFGNKLQEQRKNFHLEKNDMNKERITFQSKEKQYMAEIRKKDNSIKMMQDRLHELQLKKAGSKKNDGIPRINSLEIKGEILKKGPKFYSEPSKEFLNLMQENNSQVFEKLKKENKLLRENLNEFQKLMIEIVNIRKVVFERNFGKLKDQSELLTELKKEVFSLGSSSISAVTLEEMKLNIKKFRDFMDRMDSLKLGIRLENYAKDDTQIEIEGIEDIKNLKKLKELISNFFLLKNIGHYKFIVEAQDDIIKKSILNKSKSKIAASELANRFSIMDRTGLDKAKKFLKKQKEMIKKCNEDFESARRMTYDTNKRIESERTSVLQRRSDIEGTGLSNHGAMEIESNPAVSSRSNFMNSEFGDQGRYRLFFNFFRKEDAGKMSSEKFIY